MSALPRVAILDDYQGIALTSADWSPLEGRVTIDVFKDHIVDEDALAQRLEPYTIICAMRERTKFPRSLLDRLPNLRYRGIHLVGQQDKQVLSRFIASTGRRNRGIDIRYANERGILVSGTGMGGKPVLEHIWALILATVRYICVEDKNLKTGNPQWQSTLPLGLSGRTLGLIGVGKLGAETARVAKAFDLNVIGWSPHFTRERAAAAGVEYVETMDELLRRSDIVSLHLVLSESTHHIVGERELALLKPTAFFINTARGQLVDERALLDVLENERIAGAGLDVYETEPLPMNHRFRSLENVTLSPHTGGLSDSNWQVFYGQSVENIVYFMDSGKATRVL